MSATSGSSISVGGTSNISSVDLMPNVVLDPAVPPDVFSTIEDRDRLCPMFAGAAMIAGDTLCVRGVNEDIDIAAPRRLLADVFRWCDGTRTFNEILALQTSPSRRDELSSFIQFLLDEGALIDAVLVAAQALRYGLQLSPFGQAAAAPLTDKISRRFLWDQASVDRLKTVSSPVEGAPLQGVFERRVTTCSFGDKPLAEESLHRLVWSIAGVVQTSHPRKGLVAPQRTLASAGGLHLLEVYVALRRPVGSYVPGVYRVHYPRERTVLLSQVHDGAHDLPLAFVKPWELTFAAGAVFIAADPVVAAMRYRSRSLQYLFMEAGAALHNAALSADDLGLGFAPIGGYYEQAAGRLCHLDRQVVLGAGLFGVKPTPEQLALVPRSANFDFVWVNGESPKFSMSFHLARAKLKTPQDDRPYAWGRDTDPWMAMVKATAEAIEREGFRHPRHITEAKFNELPTAVHPHQFVRYSASQHRLKGFPYLPFDEQTRYAWAQGRSCLTGARVDVLAELVFSRTSLKAAGFSVDRPFTQTTSSGCAAGATHEDAVHRALLEVVERDAFMSHWLAQSPGQHVPAALLPAPIRHRLDAIVAIGGEIVIQRLKSAWAEVALVAVQHHGLHFTTMGTAASSELVEAIAAALDEAEARVYAWLHGHRATIRSAHEVDNTAHHFELYGLKPHYRRADAVLFSSSEVPLEHLPAAALPQGSESLLQRFAAQGLDPMVVDITPDNCRVDQGRRQLHVIKALIPTLLPVSFGHRREPLGMVARVHTSSKFPHPFP